MERLERYLWFGNLAELETVLTRTIALAQSDTIDAIRTICCSGTGD